MKQKLIENMGFIYLSIGCLIALIAIVALPYPTQAVVAPKKHVHVAQASPLSIRESVLVAAYRHGWTGNEWTCLRKIIALENPAWLPHLQNKRSTASGIFQMVRSISGAMFNGYSVEQQAKLGTKYIAHRYGTPCKALHFHHRKGSY